jgi:hypothetical protein
LRDDADAETLCLQQSADHRHAERRLIDVGVAGDNDDITESQPSVSISARDMGQKTAHTKVLGPVFRVAVEGGAGLGNGDGGHG